MRARILYTNGSRTDEMFWISHTGSDVYCGPTGESFKVSYHSSGKVHTKSDGMETSGTYHVPLPELRGYFHLTSMGFNSSEEWFKIGGRQPQYRVGKADVVVVIDSRTIPDHHAINIAVGLLEPGATDAISRMLVNLAAGVRAVQVLIGTSAAPWICVIIYVMDGAEFERALTETPDR